MRRLGLLICAVLLLAVFCGAIPRTIYWAALVHFYLNKRSYETTAQRMLAAKNEVDRQRICGEKCWLLSSDQVAFHYSHGFLSWDDIIYDPSGKIGAMKSWEERRQLNIYFVGAEHLTGDWYLGHFGD